MRIMPGEVKGYFQSMGYKVRARIYHHNGHYPMPWRVVFTHQVSDRPWLWHGFYRWEDAVKFTFDILGPDDEKREFWLRQLRW